MRFILVLLVLFSTCLPFQESQAISEEDLLTSSLLPGMEYCYLKNQKLRAVFRTKTGRLVDAQSLRQKLKRKLKNTTDLKKQERLEKRIFNLTNGPIEYCKLFKSDILGSLSPNPTATATPSPTATPSQQPTPTPTPTSSLPPSLVGTYQFSSIVSLGNHTETYTIALNGNGTFELKTSGVATVHYPNVPFPASFCTTMVYSTSSTGIASVSSSGVLSLTPSVHKYRTTGHSCYSPSISPADFTMPVNPPFTVQDEIALSSNGQELHFFGQPGQNIYGEPAFLYGFCSIDYAESGRWPVCDMEELSSVVFIRQ